MIPVGTLCLIVGDAACACHGTRVAGTTCTVTGHRIALRLDHEIALARAMCDGDREALIAEEHLLPIAPPANSNSTGAPKREPAETFR
jgi:hypothetical protein